MTVRRNLRVAASRDGLAQIAARVARRMAGAVMLGALSIVPAATRADTAPDARIEQAVDAAIRPMMARNQIPGVAVGIVIDGKAAVFNYGVASLDTRQPVTGDTLFELGSVTKTFTATLSAWAQENGQLQLADPVGKYLPELRGTPFGSVSLLNLGTHTPGGLPLQVPDAIHDDDQLMQYFKAWRPAHEPGTWRTYANPGIGTLGLITAKSMGQDFNTLIEQRLFPALGLKNSFIDVPAARVADYAQGYTKDGRPIRMAGGVLASEAYGVKSTAADMLRFVEANMNMIPLDAQVQRAITATHTGYFKAGPMTQDLIWEQYPYPVSLQTVLQGNAPAMALQGMHVSAIEPPLAPMNAVWINKTGGTNGFGAYVAFVPAKHMGIVILANRSFANDDRVAAAWKILASLEGRGE